MLLKTANVVFFLAMVYVNYLANALPLNSKTTGQLSEQYPNLFVPAGITFSIWGIIYLLLLGFCLVQFRDHNKGLILSVGWAFAISCLLNALWIVAWHYEHLPWSLLIMLGLLTILIIINVNLSDAPRGLIKAAFGIYLGWICIATIANITALLVHYNWGGWGISHEAWTIVMILAGTIIATLAITRFQNPYIGLAVGWAFIGIILKRQGDYQSIMIAAILGIVMVATVTGWMLFRENA